MHWRRNGHAIWPTIYSWSLPPFHLGYDSITHFWFPIHSLATPSQISLTKSSKRPSSQFPSS
jgi:hypothetical protein